MLLQRLLHIFVEFVLLVAVLLQFTNLCLIQRLEYTGNESNVCHDVKSLVIL